MFLLPFTPFSSECYFKIFDAKVTPILLYGFELWGIRRQECIEHVHNYACKRFLSVPKYTCNDSVLGDCGRYLMYILSCKRMVCYWLKILKMPKYRYVYKCYI